jgi:acetolactate synthase-1/2/3 large subunit
MTKRRNLQMSTTEAKRKASKTTPAPAKKMTGAEMVIEALIEQGVEVIFGYPGGAVLPIYDEIFKNKDRIKHVLVRHEQGAVHAAEGYARSTGKVGCFARHLRPGATNAVTGLTDALMDSIPVVCITGQVPDASDRHRRLPGGRHTGITRPCTKHNYLVKDVNELAGAIHEGFHVARSGRPGPVVIDIPKDIQFAQGNYKAAKDSMKHAYKPRTMPTWRHRGRRRTDGTGQAPGFLYRRRRYQRRPAGQQAAARPRARNRISPSLPH